MRVHHQHRRLDARHLVAGLAGAGGVLVALNVPVGLLELAMSSTGISEILPAAAPPYGLTARLAVSAFAGSMAVGVALAKAPVGQGQQQSNRGNGTMGFAFSKLASLGRKRPARELGVPTLRRQDAHPDAPARQPIFAVRDLGSVDLVATPSRDATDAAPTLFVVNNAPVADRPVSTMAELEGALLPKSAEADYRMPQSPEPMDEAELIREASIAAIASTAMRNRPRPAMVVQSPDDSSPDLPSPDRLSLDRLPPARPALSPLSLAELAARLERSLNQRATNTPENQAEYRNAPATGPAMVPQPAFTPEAVLAITPRPQPVLVVSAASPVLAQIPPASPVPVKASVDADVDEALRAALGTLQKIAARAR
ncbi:hypothetical protein PX699_06820 [Sphingobium sp. H39-3-25]|uniref:hypothetical protein n=1 Tax=Sphingobium arseniciresistens TaxID=3030834 RepID=UPI0023B93768|nr:hypothetical protein [Sphingobium arseniciresistens]